MGKDAKCCWNPAIYCVRLLRWGCRRKRWWMTFDDGPDPQSRVAAELLDVLQHHQARACFDPIGEQVARCPAIVRRIAAEGHLIANHSFTHPVPIGWIRWLPEQIDPTDRALGEVLGVSGYHSRFFRPPHGMLTPALHAAMRQRELRLLPVTYFVHDTAYGPATAHRVLKRLLAGLRRDEGGVIVLHDGRCRRPPGHWRGQSGVSPQRSQPHLGTEYGRCPDQHAEAGRFSL